MLERLQKELANGPAVMQLTLHGPTTQIVKKALVVSADQIGIVARMKGMLGGDYGPDRLFPWTAVSIIDFV